MSATRRACCASDRADPAEGRHPRSAGRGGPGLALDARLRGLAGAGWAARRPRGRGRRPGRGARRGRADVRRSAHERAGRGLRGRRGGRLMEPARFAVVTFPGSNDDGDARLALEALGAVALPVWHTDEQLSPEVGGIVLPGGFSYGDYLRCGALARVAPVMDAVRAFATAGGPVIGIC